MVEIHPLFCTQNTDMNNKYLPINKGHYDLDTRERTVEFYQKLAAGWEDQYNKYRHDWVELPRMRTVRDYPLHIDAELSTICNLNCPMCYTKTEMFKDNVEKCFMDFGLFKKIVDQIAGKVYSLRLSLRGESSLHPNFVDAVAYAKSRGIREVSSLTNGSMLGIELFSNMAEAGIDWISISVDGLDEQYSQIRNPLIFEETLENLKAIRAYKDKYSLLKPVIKVQGIWPAIRQNPTRYYETLAPYVDLVAFNPLIDYLCNDQNILYEDGFVCPQVYQRLVIGSNGRALLCANDQFNYSFAGDATKQSIHEIWHGKEMSNIRSTHLKPKGFMHFNICRECYYPRKTSADEIAVVGHREIIIENYINRPQNVGD